MYNKLLKTDKYDMFNKQTGNRDLKRVKELKDTILLDGNSYPFFSPIIVNDDLEVIDGQHRLEICKELKCEVEYIVRKGLKIYDTVNMNRVANAWKNSDIITSYIDRGLGLFPDVNILCKKYNLDPVTILGIVDRKYTKRDALIKCKAVLPISRDDLYAKVDKYAPLLKDILSHRVNANSSKCSTEMLESIMRMIDSVGYDHSVFVAQLDKYPHLFRSANLIKYNIEMLETLYNYRRHGKIFRIE